MAFKQYGDVRETSVTGGAGDQVLTGSAFDASYFRFADRYSDGDTFFYCMKLGTAREIGLGTRVASGDKVSRTKVYKSTNSNNLASFAAGQIVDIFVTPVAPSDLDAAGLTLLADTEGANGIKGADIASASTLNLDVCSSGRGEHYDGAGRFRSVPRLRWRGVRCVSYSRSMYSTAQSPNDNSTKVATTAYADAVRDNPRVLVLSNGAASANLAGIDFIVLPPANVSHSTLSAFSNAVYGKMYPVFNTGGGQCSTALHRPKCRVSQWRGDCDA